MCGEKDTSTVFQVDHEGLPPRVRGKVHISTGQVGGVGITPAYAGKRDRPRSGPGTTRDHPRVCGEKSDIAKNQTLKWGSPPRMRGKVLFKTLGEGTFGITPAYAGKS